MQQYADDKTIQIVFSSEGFKIKDETFKLSALETSNTFQDEYICKIVIYFHSIFSNTHI